MTTENASLALEDQLRGPFSPENYGLDLNWRLTKYSDLKVKLTKKISSVLFKR